MGGGSGVANFKEMVIKRREQKQTTKHFLITGHALSIRFSSNKKSYHKVQKMCYYSSLD